MIADASLLYERSYLAVFFLRRRIATAPAKPVENSDSVRGSGTDVVLLPPALNPRLPVC